GCRQSAPTVRHILSNSATRCTYISTPPSTGVENPTPVNAEARPGRYRERRQTLDVMRADGRDGEAGPERVGRRLKAGRRIASAAAASPGLVSGPRPTTGNPGS